MSNKIMTAEQAFNLYMNKYPTLGISNSLEESKIKFFDHLFNCIGNGYNDDYSFIAGHTINPSNISMLDSFPEKYISSEPLFIAYTKLDKRYSCEFGDESSKLKGYYTQEEIDNMPEVVIKDNFRDLDHLSEDEKDEYKFSPYPNFRKEYSFVYNINIESLDISWTNAALWYYNEMKNFFEGPDNYLYSYAVPKAGYKLKKEIESWEGVLDGHKENGIFTKESYDSIFEKFKVNFNGDIHDFINQKWENIRQEIINFIDETISYLEQIKYIKEPAISRKRKF